MPEQSNVVSLPGRKRKPGKFGDEKLADDVMKTWRAFCRAVEKAEGAGLNVDHPSISKYISPTVMRKF